MLRRRRWVPLLALLLVATAGCTPVPTPPTPEPTRDAVETPTPSPEPVWAPEAAFDLPCDDVVFAMTDLFGIPSAPVTEHLWLKESPNWYPGPAQYMFSRAGGRVCAYDDGETSWQITAVTGAQEVLEDLAANGYPDWDQSSQCHGGRCAIVVRDRDVLVEATVIAPEITEADLEPVRTTIAALAARAAASAEPVEIVPSPIVGVECEQLLAPEALEDAWDIPARLEKDFGGWGIPASVYWNRDGARACSYLENPGEYEGDYYLTLTTLPAGRWASELQTGRSAIDIDGADAAFFGQDGYYDDLQFIDVVVGDDWIRVSGPARSARDLADAAEIVVTNMAALA